MSKFISLAMSHNSRTILHCAGTWIDQQGPTSDRPLQLAQFIVDRQILLIPESGQAMDMIKKLPEIVPLFIAGFMTSITELYFTKFDNPPPKRLVDLLAAWMTNSSLLPLRPVLLPGSVSSSPQTPLLGLAKWTVMAAIFQQVMQFNTYSIFYLYFIRIICLFDSISRKYTVVHKWVLYFILNFDCNHCKNF